MPGLPKRSGLSPILARRYPGGSTKRKIHPLISRALPFDYSPDLDFLPSLSPSRDIPSNARSRYNRNTNFNENEVLFLDKHQKLLDPGDQSFHRSASASSHHQRVSRVVTRRRAIDKHRKTVFVPLLFPFPPFPVTSGMRAVPYTHSTRHRRDESTPPVRHLAGSRQLHACFSARGDPPALIRSGWLA